MSAKGGKEKIHNSFFERAKERWGEEEARALKPTLDRIDEAVCKVERFELGIEEEPSNPPRKGGR
jgi:hypothetical protein